MYKIIDGHGTGKTTRLITLAKETDATIVARDPDYVRYKAERLGIFGVEVLSYEEFIFLRSQKPEKRFLLDEILTFANYMTAKTGGKLLGYTFSDNDID